MQKWLTRPPILLGSHHQLSITRGPIPNWYRPRIDATLRPYRSSLRAKWSRACQSQVNTNSGYSRSL